LVLGLAITAVACGGGGGGGGDASADGGDTGGADAPAGGGGGNLPQGEFELARDVELADGTVIAAGETATVSDLLDGERPVVLNFFASWCPPCRAEMPDLQKVFEDIQGQVNFVGLTNSDEQSAAAALVDEVGVQYPWGHPGTDQYVAFRLFGMPSTVYISPEGEVLQADNGLITEDQFRERLAELFGVET
jgi:thiol-disulfide isomerase/thioredoxin